MSIAGCSNSPIVTGVVVFEETAFKAAFPAFTSLAGGLLQICFDLATLLLNNSCCSIVQDANVRQSLLWLLTAHIAAIQFGQNGQPATGIVGRISDATQGSVTVRAQWAAQYSEHAAYYLQTSYGALYWQASGQFRVGMYVPAPRRRYGPPDPRLRGWDCE